jgi:tetratricopeptide (TPR) repeat protein
MQKAQEAFRKGRYNVSIKALKKFLEGAEAEKRSRAIAYIGLGSNYVETMVHGTADSAGCFSKAEQYFNKALTVMEVSDGLSPAVYSGLGYLYLRRHAYERALAYLDRGLAYYPREGSLKEQGDIYTNLGYCYLAMNDRARAEEYFKKAIAVFTDADYDVLKGALTGLAICSRDSGSSPKGK